MGYKPAAAHAKAHPLLRHGDQVELSQRSIDGTLPETGLPASSNARGVDSTRWLNNEDMLTAVKQAQAQFSANGGRAGKYDWDAGKVIGEGYYKGGNTYAATTNFEVILNT